MSPPSRGTSGRGRGSSAPADPTPRVTRATAAHTVSMSARPSTPPLRTGTRLIEDDGSTLDVPVSWLRRDGGGRDHPSGDADPLPLQQADLSQVASGSAPSQGV